MTQTKIADEGADRWFAWLTSERHGGDAGYAAALAPEIARIRDLVLDHAGLRARQTIADIGCGDGMMGFAALERAPGARVVFADLSPALVAHARERAQRLGVGERCRFVVAAADALAAIPDSSVDVVLVRAVLAYVADKDGAVREFRRILRPRGRISVADPINADRAFATAAMAAQLSRSGGEPAVELLELLHRVSAAHFPDSLDAIRADPLTNYDERDLLRSFERAGFVDIHLRLHVDCVRALPIPWHTFLASAPRAGVPTIGEVLRTRFSPAERAAYERAMRPALEAGALAERNVNAYLFADAP